MARGDEKIIDGGYLGKSYIIHENYDGSKTIYEQGPMGGRGAEVGKEIYSQLYGYTKVSSNGGSTNVHTPTIYGPDLNTSSGVSRALRDASGNAPRPPSSESYTAYTGINSSHNFGTSYHGSLMDYLYEWMGKLPRITRSIIFGFLMFIMLIPALPYIVGGYLILALFLGQGLLNSWVWGAFSVVLFLSPFPVGFFISFLEENWNSN